MRLFPVLLFLGKWDIIGIPETGEKTDYMNKNMIYRCLPDGKSLLEDPLLMPVIENYGRESVKDVIHLELDKLRSRIKSMPEEEEFSFCREELIREVAESVEKRNSPRMKMVINGTGTILHTNLGRAPIGEKHLANVLKAVSHYSNLEFDLETGKRGERYSHFEELLCRLTGAEAAMAVNNNASAVLLILSTLAKGGEVLVSRGELVEIGGKFRVPDVMEQSGAVLREVGTTNKTHPEDYEHALGDNTKAIMKVHTSNYRILGFTHSVGVEELAPIAAQRGIPLIEDLGSGAFIDFAKYGLAREPLVQEAVKKGADIVCFSGDKLFGGPQAGIIVGKKEYITKIKAHPLTRALRIDKFTAAVLEQVLLEYLNEYMAVRNIPVLHMITASMEEIRKRGEKLLMLLRQKNFAAEFQITESIAQFGGGALPLEQIPSYAVTIRCEKVPPSLLGERLRSLTVPVIPRIAEDKILLDMRTVWDDQTEVIVRELEDGHVFEQKSDLGAKKA